MLSSRSVVRAGTTLLLPVPVSSPPVRTVTGEPPQPAPVHSDQLGWHVERLRQATRYQRAPAVGQRRIGVDSTRGHVVAAGVQRQHVAQTVGAAGRSEPAVVALPPRG